MFQFSDPVVGGTVLVRPAIQSPNYVPGVSGWSVKIDGSAEFNNLTIRGQFFGTDFEINATGAFFYSGTPAAGNLIGSITSGPMGTDRFGNTYLPGITSYGTGGNPAAFQAFGDSATFYQFLTNGQNVTLAQCVGLGVVPTGLTAFAAGKLTVPPVLIAADPGSPASFTESWHTLALLNGFTAGNDINGTSYPPAIMLTNEGDVKIRGELVTPSTGTVNGITFATTPYAAYNPGTNVPTATIANNTGGQVGVVYIRPNGNIQVTGAFGNSAQIRLDATLHAYGV